MGQAVCLKRLGAEIGRGLLIAGLALRGAWAAEPSYNGIVPAEPWPPPIAELTRQPPATPPYLTAPPAVIPIDVGRQLLVDDFLVEYTTLTRTHHRPEYHPASPVLAPDQPWEGSGARARAAPFSDGVWFDPAEQRFKMWYWGGAGTAPGGGNVTCYATSRDGIRWENPSLDVVPGTNIVLADEPGWRRNSNTVWLDQAERDPARRFKMFRVSTHEFTAAGKKQSEHVMRVYFSPDGIHWSFAAQSDACGDRSTVFFNPFRRVWVYSLRDGGTAVSRCRSYQESAAVLDGLHWAGRPKRWWVGADEWDPDRHDLELRRIPERPWDLVPSQLYNLDCVAYESLLLGLFSIWRGHPNTPRPKINEVCVGFSRDGFHWSRPDRRAFCPVSETKDDWNWGNVQSAGGGCLVVGDRLYFYAGGVSGRRGGFHPDPSYTGLAVLRRDGFASLDAGPREGTLTTRPVRFRGRHLAVNVDAPQGRLVAEIVDADGRAVPSFTRADCLPLTADRTLQAVQWCGGQDLSALAGTVVRFRFHLTQGRLYAFWVSPEATGASHGYVAAGGPGFTGSTDTVGRAALADLPSP